MNDLAENQETAKPITQYPNLFRYYVGGCQHTFDSIHILTDKGYQPADTWPSEMAAILQTDEIVLNSQVSKNLYIKHFDNYQIMHIVTERKLMHLNDPFSLSLSNQQNDYYISGTILLDKYGKLVKNIEHGLPSIVFYREENVRYQCKSTIILDAFYTFQDGYYSFTDIENVDNYMSKYSFVFRDYNHKIMATASHRSESIESILLSNSTFYFNDKIYNHDLLSEIDNTLSGKNFANLLRGRASMTQRQLDLLAMSLI